MRHHLWPLLLLGACAPTGENPRGEGNLAYDPPALMPPGPGWRPSYTGPAYFPASLGVPTERCSYEPTRLQPVLSDFERDWYSLALAAAGEPSLYLASRRAPTPGGGTLRFTLLHDSIRHVVVRIETGPEGGPRLVAKKVIRTRANRRRVGRTIERALTAHEAEGLRAVLARTRVFEIPPDPCGGGCDGTQWIFEQARGRDYRFLSIWEPSGRGRELGEFLLSLPGPDFSL
jgi:hypothetical protein